MKQLLLFVITLSINICNAQTAKVWLDSIAKNNKEIKSSIQFWEAQKLEYRTGLNPPNPTVEYDYLVGSPAGAGNQTDLNVIQTFEFPTTYFKKRSLASEQAKQPEFQLKVQRQDVLLQANLHLLEVIYLNKKQSELRKRLINVESLKKDFETRLEKGDANILDVNKTKLQKIQIETEARRVESEKAILLQKLAEMNGGNPVTLTDTIYQVEAITLGFDSLEKLIESNDPNLKYFMQQKEISETQVGLTKALRLPKFETGYHSQAILGQNFRGIHFGMSIPLWENRNTVSFQKANVLYSELKIEEHRTKHYFEVKQQYEEYVNLKKSLEAYRAVLTSINSRELLWKAFQLGEISVTEYFMETTYFFSTYDTYLQLEKDYYQSMARLNKYTL
jgi:outer membrane protein, heavy metal efflux system